ncbi:unnamed protein product [Euphydryas editha]|uniref:EF-hand domain-containing protein n=1 Tax=Euphydryas editha TaxID=104508 RepID=A0AAU9U027_EUPED|nr:unnamed protein product [Euphydryas editha]
MIAAEAKYPAFWFTNFSNKLSSSSPLQKPRQNNQVTEAVLEIFNYIENNDDSQFTLKEFKDVLTEVLTDIIITKKVGAFTIIFVRDAHNLLQLQGRCGLWMQEIGVAVLISLWPVKWESLFQFQPSHSDVNEDKTIDCVIMENLEICKCRRR